MPGNEARQVAGSIDKRDQILAGKSTVEEVYNGDKDALYQWMRMGKVAQTTAMPKIHPDVLRSGDAPTIQAAEALVKALTVPDWGTKKFQAGKMTRNLEAGLLPYSAVPEVQQVLNAIKNKQALDSRLIHYVKRRFLEKEAMNAPNDLDQWFESVMADQKTKVFQPGPNPNSRYVLYSDQHHLLAVIERNGQRVSAHDHDGLNLGAVWSALLRCKNITLKINMLSYSHAAIVR